MHKSLHLDSFLPLCPPWVFDIQIRTRFKVLCVWELHGTDEICSVELQNARQSSKQAYTPRVHTHTHMHTHTHLTQQTLSAHKRLYVRHAATCSIHDTLSPRDVYLSLDSQTSACEGGGVWEDAITTSRLHPNMNERTWGN